MKPHGTYKLTHRRLRTGLAGAVDAGPASPVFDAYLDSVARGEERMRRILDSLRSEIVEGGGGQNLRIRRIFQAPREIYRLELALPELGYQRTTLLDRDALEELLETDEVRAAVAAASLGH
jgi:hypothetical protein